MCDDTMEAKDSLLEKVEEEKKKFLRAELIDLKIVLALEGKEVEVTLEDFISKEFALPWSIDRMANDDDILKMALLKLLNK